MKVIDMHCDTISRLLEAGDAGEAGHLDQNDKMVDLARLEKSDYMVQNFALFVDKGKFSNPYQHAIKLLTLFWSEMKLCGDRLRQVFSIEDIIKNESEGVCSALLTLEEGGVCEGKIEKLNFFYEQGVRMMTLTWNYPNELGFPNFTASGGLFQPDMMNGLTDTGINFVREMERLGMIIDVSHLSDAGFYDVLKYTTKPFVASHSNARAVCPVVRNMTDDMIKKLADRGGVIGLNFCTDFLGAPTMEAIAKHARHIANVGGVSCIGLGSDFDGIPLNPGITGVEMVPQLIDEFKKAGFTESEIEKIFYKNVFRLYSDIL